MQEKQTVNKLIAEGTFADALAILEGSARSAKDRAEILQLTSRLNTVRRDSRHGVIDYESEILEINRIRRAIIALSGEIFADRRAPSGKTGRRYVPLIAVAAIVLAGLLFVFALPGLSEPSGSNEATSEPVPREEVPEPIAAVGTDDVPVAETSATPVTTGKTSPAGRNLLLPGTRRGTAVVGLDRGGNELPELTAAMARSGPPGSVIAPFKAEFFGNEVAGGLANGKLQTVLASDLVDGLSGLLLIQLTDSTVRSVHGAELGLADEQLTVFEFTGAFNFVRYGLGANARNLGMHSTSITTRAEEASTARNDAYRKAAISFKNKLY